MYTKTKLNHFDIANEIYEFMRYEYKFLTAQGMEVDKCITTLSNKLSRLKDHQVLQWHQALNEIAETHSDRAPTPAEIIRAIVKRSNSIAIEEHPEVKQQEVKPYIDYEALWKSADDKGKFKFFIDHKFCDVPPYVRYWFVKYNREYRGWTAHESNMMIGFWKSPFIAAHSGAVANHQYEILDYFKERTND